MQLSKLLNFFLFYIEYEPVFYKMSAMGNFNHLREYAYSYANPIILEIKDYSIKHGKITQNILEEYIKRNKGSNIKSNGLHFKSFNINKDEVGSSFEIRVFNGTLDYRVIRNYLNMSLASVNYATSENFSQRKFLNLCKNALKERSSWTSFDTYVKMADNLVEEFVSLVFLSQEEKQEFLSQYDGKYLKLNK